MNETTLGGKYRLTREIGSGGMGSVWIARDETLRRTVALKLMLPAHVDSDDLRRRFEREAMAVARLRHPNVVQIFDYGVTDSGTPYMVMELLDGEDLEHRLAREPRLPPAVLVPILVQAAKGLSAAHEAGIIHRDLKPANVFLARHGGEISVKILDFGVAAMRHDDRDRLDRSELATHTWCGTLEYMSPEQAHIHGSVDHRSDLWSLAVIAYRAITGKVPFALRSGANTPEEIQERIRTELHDNPSAVDPDLDSTLDAFFERALAKQPRDRHPSALEMAGELAALYRHDRPRRAVKVLVIDDEAPVEALIRQAFRGDIRAGTYEFVFADNGVRGLEQLAEHRDIDIVLSDIKMPEMDGLTFLSKAALIDPMLKIIMVSAYNDMSNIRTAMNRGAFDFVIKPIDLGDLSATLGKAALESQKGRQSAELLEENQALRMFVDNEILRRILPMLRATDQAGSERIDATVALIGMCQVPEIAQRSSPDRVARLLNAQFDVIISEVRAQGGEIIKLVGHAVLALFRDNMGDALRACAAICDHLQELAHSEDDNAAYLQGISIGMARGPVISCSVGSIANQRLEHTLVGGPVIRAIALQAAAAHYQILADASVAGPASSSHVWRKTPFVPASSSTGESDADAVELTTYRLVATAAQPTHAPGHSAATRIDRPVVEATELAERQHQRG